VSNHLEKITDYTYYATTWVSYGYGGTEPGRGSRLVDLNLAWPAADARADLYRKIICRII